jgi:outer membrane protein OmpA-like peptidoglycan-associated protein
MALAGCAGPVATYHNVEGGAIAQARQAPPGSDLPYPNLASVPRTPTPLTERQIEAVGVRLAPVPAAQPAIQANAAALEGLALPGGAPPAPDVPGIFVPPTPAPHVLTYSPPPPAPPAKVRVDSAPVAIGFQPGSAILDGETLTALAKIAAARGDATMVAGGFGRPGAVADEAALRLGLDRARAIADALTAAGVPARDVTLVAGADGAGGFVRLVY